MASQLTSMGFEWLLFRSADEYWRTFDPLQPGCLLFDGRSTIGGIPLLERLASGPLAPPVIYLSDETDASTVVKVMKAGAIDFLQERTFTGTDLWEAIQRGLFADKAKRATHVRRKEREARLATLTDSERQVFELILRGKSNREIADELEIGAAAVEGRRTRLMKKLGVETLVALVRFAVDADFPPSSRLDM